MIHCIPSGICSWDYRLDGENHSGAIHFNGFGEQGSLVADGNLFEVTKGGWLSGEWSLLDHGKPLALARKTTVFGRSFELSGPAGTWRLEAPSTFSREMHLVGERTDCKFVPAHAFTRRAFIEGSFDDFRVVSFAFWLTALTWRRAASSNSG